MQAASRVQPSPAGPAAERPLHVDVHLAQPAFVTKNIAKDSSLGTQLTVPTLLAAATPSGTHLSCASSSAGHPVAMTACLCGAVLLAMLTTTYMACIFSCRAGDGCRDVRGVSWGVGCGCNKGGRPVCLPPCGGRAPQGRVREAQLPACPADHALSSHAGTRAHPGLALAALQRVPHRLQQAVGGPVQRRLDVGLHWTGALAGKSQSNPPEHEHQSPSVL